MHIRKDIDPTSDHHELPAEHTPRGHVRLSEFCDRRNGIMIYPPFDSSYSISPSQVLSYLLYLFSVVSDSSEIGWCVGETPCLRTARGSRSGPPPPVLTLQCVVGRPCSGRRSCCPASLTPVQVSEALHCTSGAVSWTTVNAAGAERSGLRVGRPSTAHANTTQYIQITHQSIAMHPISTSHALRVGPVRSCSRYTARRKLEQHGQRGRVGVETSSNKDD